MAIRLKDGKKPFQPHRRHIYQLLANEKGIAHWRVSVGYGLLQAFVGLSALGLRNYGLVPLLVALLGAYFVAFEKKGSDLFFHKREKHKALVVGREVAPQLNTLEGDPSEMRFAVTASISRGKPGSTGEGGPCHNNKRRYPARAIGGNVAQDLFNRGLCLPSGTAMAESDLDRVISVIKKCREQAVAGKRPH